jgi:hypothetical protein
MVDLQIVQIVGKLCFTYDNMQRTVWQCDSAKATRFILSKEEQPSDVIHHHFLLLVR